MDSAPDSDNRCSTPPLSETTETTCGIVEVDNDSSVCGVIDDDWMFKLDHTNTDPIVESLGSQIITPDENTTVKRQAVSCEQMKNENLEINHICCDGENENKEPISSDMPSSYQNDVKMELIEQNSSVIRMRNNISVADYTRSIDPNSSPARDTYSKQKKVRNILKSLSSTDGIETLRQLAISRGGLLTDELRKRAWPLLLSVDLSSIPEKPEKEVLLKHRDYDQVVMDVNRSLKRFPPGMEESVRLSMQDQLVECIMRVLVLRNDLHYYQGYHDIVVTFLLVVGEDITVALMNQLSIKHLRDFMYENMDKTSSMLHYLYPLIGRCNNNVRRYMENADVGTMFCLPWLITWYGHVLNDVKHIVRLYDFFIACHPLMPIYLAAAIVQYREDEIMKCEPEMPFIHCLLSNIPDDLPFEHLILQAGDLFVQYPPEDLANEAKEQYEKYLEENKRKQEQLNHLRQSKLQKKNKLIWPFNLVQNRSHNIANIPRQNKSSTLVKMTVWTGAALLSAVAVTFVNTYYLNLKSLDGWMDIHWLWGSK